jgi:hypothetical protein
LGRKRLISDEKILILLNDFLIEACEGNINLFKIPVFGEYVRSNGYSNISDRLIRRNKALLNKIAELQVSEKSIDDHIISTFKTIDTQKFIENNRTKQAIVSSLTKLNSYYYSVYEAAVRINEHSKKVIESGVKINEEVKLLRVKSKSDDSEKEELRNELQELKGQNKKYKEIIETYVYPEIANELLVKDGLLKNTSDTVKESAMKKEIISSDTSIKSDSNVIKGMFDDLGV